MSARLAGLALLVTMLVYAASGVMLIDPGEQAVVYRFGEVSRTVSAGLRFRLPVPFEDHTSVHVAEVQRLETGSLRLLTGDTNLVDVAMVVQYTISDVVAHELSFQDPRAVISAQVIATTSAIVSTLDVDRLLTTGRAELQRQVLENSQRQLDALQGGIHLAAVEVRELSPPPAVVDAFNEVSSARGDRETLALSAEAYASTVIPDARGKAAQQLESARAAASQTIARATAKSQRFEILSTEHQLAPQPLLSRLIADALATIGNRAQLVSSRAGDRIVLGQRAPKPPVESP